MQYENLADQNTADLAELERQSADLLEQLADLEATAQEQQAELTFREFDNGSLAQLNRASDYGSEG